MLRAGWTSTGASWPSCAPATTARAGTWPWSASLLSVAGLGADDLRNTPDWPLDPDAAFAVALRRARHRADRPELLRQARRDAGDLRGERLVARTTSTRRTRCRRRSAPTVDDLTGAAAGTRPSTAAARPCSPRRCVGLARSFGGARLGARRAARRAWPARCPAHPWHVAGTGRDATRFMEAVPGLVAKDGADGVYAAGLPDGSAVAFKVARRLGAPPTGRAAPRRSPSPAWTPPLVEAVGLTPVLGHGVPVGEVVADLLRMRAVVQRVTRASVTVDGVVVGAIDRPGLLALVGVTPGDGPAQVELVARKIAELRILRDEQSRRRRRRTGAGRQPVHALRGHPQGPPAHVERGRARAGGASRWSTPSSTPCAAAGSRWPRACSARTWRSSWSTTVP